MPEMNNSNVKWLGDIPKTWEISRIGSVYTLRNTKVSDKDYAPLSVTMKGIVPQLESAAKTNAHDDRKLVKKGDFAINSRSDRRGSCGIADRDGSVSLINTILCPNGEMNPRYYNWLFHTTQFADEFYANGHGIVDDLWTTGWQEMKRILIPLPPLEIQKSIANFLDQKCSEIDSLSADIQSQIDVLEEYKKSIITETVTKGLNPDVEMKDSGINWIGTIPVQWNLKSIRHLIIEHFSGAWGNDEKGNDNDRICMRIADFDFDKMQFKTLSSDELTTRNYNNNEIGKKTLRYGDLLIEKSGGGEKTPVGRTVVYRLPYNALFANFMDCIRLSDEMNVEFAKFVFYALYTQGITNLYFNQTTGLQNLNMPKYFREVKLPLPDLLTQKEIANHLDTKCAEIDAVIAEKKAQLETLTEYKKSLIYEYVTGKKEVPENV